MQISSPGEHGVQRRPSAGRHVADELGHTGDGQTHLSRAHGAVGLSAAESLQNHGRRVPDEGAGATPEQLRRHIGGRWNPDGRHAFWDSKDFW